MKTLEEQITNKVCFEYQGRMIVSSSVEEVKDWINSLPRLTCSEHAEKNLDCILNKKWLVWGAYNQNISPNNVEGFRLSCLKTSGISTGSIKFSLTDRNTVEEILADRAAYAKRIEAAKAKVAEIQNTLGSELLSKLNKKSKSCVDLIHWSGLKFTLMIGQKGYWFKDGLGGAYYSYIDEYFTHFDGESLITDEGLHVIAILTRFLDEN